MSSNLQLSALLLECVSRGLFAADLLASLRSSRRRCSASEIDRVDVSDPSTLSVLSPVLSRVRVLAVSGTKSSVH
jgi:hypothetical protein